MNHFADINFAFGRLPWGCRVQAQYTVRHRHIHGAQPQGRHRPGGVSRHRQSGNGWEYAEDGLDDLLEIKGVLGHGAA